VLQKLRHQTRKLQAQLPYKHQKPPQKLLQLMRMRQALRQLQVRPQPLLQVLLQLPNQLQPLRQAPLLRVMAQLPHHWPTWLLAMPTM
jgi:hypothetical protein